MLRTIYRQLTSTTVDCPRYGSHWETIGFQGTDPSTDLRGVGILGLVQVTTNQMSQYLTNHKSHTLTDQSHASILTIDQ